MSDKHNVRIIGGRFRGLTLPVAETAGLRPTPDRVRETVFSWLTPSIAGSAALDLFAGSGALGFEAYSRGARSVTLVEQDRAAYLSLKQVSPGFDSGRQIRILNADALRYLSETAEKFSLVFLDPPYQSGLLRPALEGLLRGGLLTEHSLVYVEMSAGGHLAVPGFEKLREQTAGQVKFALWRPSRLL